MVVTGIRFFRPTLGDRFEAARSRPGLNIAGILLMRRSGLLQDRRLWRVSMGSRLEEDRGPIGLINRLGFDDGRSKDGAGYFESKYNPDIVCRQKESARTGRPGGSLSSDQ